MLFVVSVVGVVGGTGRAGVVVVMVQVMAPATVVTDKIMELEREVSLEILLHESKQLISSNGCPLASVT